MGVYKEGKNWKVQVYYKDWQGNQKRKQKRGFRTKGEAKEWERDFLQQQSQGVDIEFGNFLEIYYKDMDVRLREHTMYTKRYIIELKMLPKKVFNAVADNGKMTKAEEQWEQAVEQINRYATAPRVEVLRQGTQLHKIILQFEGWELKRMEEIE